MFWTLKGIRLSKPSRRASASRRGSAMGWAVMKDILVHAFGCKNARGGSGPPRCRYAACKTSQATSLHQPLIQHGIRDLHKAGDVGAVHEVAGRAVFFGRFVAVAG